MTYAKQDQKMVHAMTQAMVDTFADYNGQSSIKLVTVTVNWTENSVAKSLSGSTLISQ